MNFKIVAMFIKVYYQPLNTEVRKRVVRDDL
jgi:hypothetical protein